MTTPNNTPDLFGTETADDAAFDDLLRRSVEAVLQANATGLDLLSTVAEMQIHRPHISRQAIRTALAGIEAWREAEQALTASFHPVLIELTSQPAG